MIKYTYFAVFLLFISAHTTFAQFAFGDHWYDNPLGFKPVELHTKNGFILPAIVAGICLIATETDTTLKNKLGFYNESGYSWGYKYPYTNLFQNNIGIQFFLRDWMSIGIDIGLYLARDSYNNTAGTSIRPFARFYPVNKENWKLYFESGGGFIYFKNNFPSPNNIDTRLGTNWNGTTRYGIGGEINISSETSVLLGIRHVHVSNGNSKGAERNPSHDSNGFFIGWSYRPL